MYKKSERVLYMVAETTMSKIGREVFGKGEADYCPKYRMEVRTPNGTVRFFALRAKSKELARLEAVKMVQEMVEAYQDERIIWRMANDSSWSFGSATQEVAPLTFKDKVKKFLDAFFEIE